MRNDNLIGCSPALRARCTILRNCRNKRIDLKISHLAAEADVTPIAIRSTLKPTVWSVPTNDPDPINKTDTAVQTAA